MNQSSIKQLFIVLKTVLLYLIKIIAIIFAWSCRIVALILNHIGQEIEKHLIKK